MFEYSAFIESKHVIPHNASDLVFGVLTKLFSFMLLLNESFREISRLLQGSNQMTESVFASLYLDSNRCAGSSQQSNYVFFVWIQHVRMLFVLKRASAPFHPLAPSPCSLAAELLPKPAKERGDEGVRE